MSIELEQIKLLREKTGAGMLSCKNALIETEGNFNEAVIILRKKGLASAEKKLSRLTAQGIIGSYVHTGSKIGVLVELNCETDFVARRAEFQQLAHNLAMQIAASDIVQYIGLSDIPQDVWDLERKIESEREDLKEKSSSIRESILKGRVEKTLKSFTLLNQPYLRDPSLNVEEYIKSHVSLFGENIQLKRFSKFVIGEKTT